MGFYSSINAQEVTAKTFSGLEFRNLGSALTPGRIADIVMHPENG